MATWVHTLLRGILWLTLGAWFGGLALFGAVVARVAFTILPSGEIAGDLVAAVLEPLQLYSVAAGVTLALIAWALERGRFTTVLPLALAATCLFSHFGVSAELTELRPLAFGDAPHAEAQLRFSRLHGLSMALFLATSLGTTILVLLHVWADRASAAAMPERSIKPM